MTDTERTESGPQPGPAASFIAARPRLFGLAYRMLGSVSESEDVLQDAYERWHRAATQESIERSEAYLTTLVTRLCIDRYKRERTRRRYYPGPWLPEPLATGEDPTQRSAEADQTLSLGILRLMESLSPLQRAVFVLAEGFDYRAAEIAEVLGRSEAHCRQLLRRARRRLATAPMPPAGPAERDRLLRNFVQAARDGDERALLRALAADVVMYSDGGGKAAAASRPVSGERAVSRLLLGVRRLAGAAGFELHSAELNGCPALLVRLEGALDTAYIVETAPGGISTIYTVRNPDKLAHLREVADQEP